MKRERLRSEQGHLGVPVLVMSGGTDMEAAEGVWNSHTRRLEKKVSVMRPQVEAEEEV